MRSHKPRTSSHSARTEKAAKTVKKQAFKQKAGPKSVVPRQANVLKKTKRVKAHPPVNIDIKKSSLLPSTPPKSPQKKR